MQNCIVTQSRLLIKQWSFGFIESSPLTRSKIHEKLFWFHTRVPFPAPRRSIILLVNYDSCWQHQMSVRARRHDRPSGRFSKSRGLSASVSFLSPPPPLRSFTCPIFVRSLTLVPCSFLLNSTETLATQARSKLPEGTVELVCGKLLLPYTPFHHSVLLGPLPCTWILLVKDA